MILIFIYVELPKLKKLKPKKHYFKMSNDKRRSSISEPFEEQENISFKNDEKNCKAFVISSSMKANLIDSQLIQTFDGSKKIVKIQDSPNSKISRLVDFVVDENENKTSSNLDKTNGSVIETIMVILI